MIAAVLAGFSFGIAGYIFQTMLRNPLANPDILGISSGSSCAVVICILVFHTGQMTRSLAAVCAGLLTVIILFGLSGHKRVAATRIIVVGIGLQAFYNAIISYLTVTGDQRDLPETLRWLNGSLDSVMLAQLPFPYRFPVGVVTGLIGAPYLIWQLMVISKRGGYDE